MSPRCQISCADGNNIVERRVPRLLERSPHAKWGTKKKKNQLQSEHGGTVSHRCQAMESDIYYCL